MFFSFDIYIQPFGAYSADMAVYYLDINKENSGYASSAIVIISVRVFSRSSGVMSSVPVTGKRTVAFAYPFGSLSEGSAEIIGSAGISVFMTCCEQPCSMNRNGRIVINRYNRESGRTAQQICEEFNNAF